MGIREDDQQFMTQASKEQSSRPSIAQADQEFLSQNQPTGQVFNQPETSPAPPPDPMAHIADRAKLSLLTKMDDKVALLKQKYRYVQPQENGDFLVGDDPRSLQQIDTDGVFNDLLGELADQVGNALLIGGQIAGDIAGTAMAGPAGVIPGNAAGALVGEGAKELIAKRLGISSNDPYQIAGNLIEQGIWGASGPIVGKAIEAGGNQVFKAWYKRALDSKIAQAGAESSKAVDGLSKVFKITAGLDETDFKEAARYGFNETINAPYTKPEHLGKIVTDFAEGVIEKDRYLGEQVGAGERWAKARYGRNKVNLEAEGNKLLETLSGDKIGIIDSQGFLNPGAFTEPADEKAVKQLLDLFFYEEPNAGKFIAKKNLSLTQAIDYKKRIGQVMDSYFNSNRVNEYARRGISEFLDGLTQKIATETIPKGMGVLDKGVVASNPYIKSNRAFSLWKKDLDLLREKGLNLTSVGDLKSMMRDGRLLSNSVENFAKTLQSRTSASQETFKIIADQLDKKFPGKGAGKTLGTLYDELRKYNAAQGFANSNPNLLRAGAVISYAGLGGGPFTAPARLVAGLALTTPKGVGTLMKVGEKVTGKVGSVTTTVPRIGLKVKVDPRLSRALLSRLLASNYGSASIKKK